MYITADQKGPQPFWHQGPISWKTVFPWMVSRGWFWDDLKALYVLSFAEQEAGLSNNVSLWGAAVNTDVSFAACPALTLQLCGPVPTCRGPGAWGPLYYRITTHQALYCFLGYTTCH